MLFKKSKSNEESSSSFPVSRPAEGGLIIQRKLAIGSENDPLEHEADAMADNVMSMQILPSIENSKGNNIQRKCSQCEEEEKVQRKPFASFIQRKESANGVVANDVINSQINSSKGNGSAIDANTRSFMESRFGTTFSGVKIHTNDEAIHMNRELNAKAFTVGNDIYFNNTQYQPDSDSGKHLLAHELTHTLQQGYSAGLLQQKPAPKTEKDVEKCMAQDSDLLPHTGFVEHIHREVELKTVLGSERAVLEQQIKINKDARRFVCEAGVPAIVALYDTLYDTRNARIKLEVDCARQALSLHPEHYSFTALNKKREEIIPIGYTSFDRSTPLAPLKTGKAIQVDPGRQVRILSEDKSKNNYLVRVISGPQHCKEGYIKMNTVNQASQSTLEDIKRVSLVFFQNPERIGENIVEIKTAVTVRQTKLRVAGVGKGKETFIPVPKDSHITLDKEDTHTDKEYFAEVKFETTGKEIWGFIPKADVVADTAFRTSQRRFFVRDVGLELAKKRKSIFVDIPRQLCSGEHWPIEFFSAYDIVNGILTAAHCSNKLVDEVHIVGHGGPHGMGGTGNVVEQNGIYVQQEDATFNKMTALTAIDFARETAGALADNVRFWLHACKTAEDYKGGPGFGEQLGSALTKEGGHSGAQVGGLFGRGRADKGINRVYPFTLFPGRKEEKFPK